MEMGSKTRRIFSILLLLLSLASIFIFFDVIVFGEERFANYIKYSNIYARLVAGGLYAALLVFSIKWIIKD